MLLVLCAWHHSIAKSEQFDQRLATSLWGNDLRRTDNKHTEREVDAQFEYLSSILEYHHHTRREGAPYPCHCHTHCPKSKSQWAGKPVSRENKTTTRKEEERYSSPRTSVVWREEQPMWMMSMRTIDILSWRQSLLLLSSLLSSLSLPLQPFGSDDHMQRKWRRCPPGTKIIIKKAKCNKEHTHTDKYPVSVWVCECVWSVESTPVQIKVRASCKGS